jgi:hypothetical protein
MLNEKPFQLISFNFRFWIKYGNLRKIPQTNDRPECISELPNLDKASGNTDFLHATARLSTHLFACNIEYSSMGNFG